MYIFEVYTLIGVNLMKTAKIFKSGNSQAVRLPKELQFDVSEVEIFRRGDEIVLRKKPQNLARVFELLADMSEDFMENGRRQPFVQGREPF
jgi:antitoxin VapB